ncbi:MAG: TonB-dependent receptor [Bacteroidia bacterium]|nr:TonB-dependent receptor [Bacteroidia bacterium]
MKKATYLFGFFLGILILPNQSNAQSTDTIANEKSIEAVLVRASAQISNISIGTTQVVYSKELQSKNLGQDIPMILQHQTGVISTSDAGNGIGYTGIRVRGSDATRTQVNINGVPINDAESQGTFWVNMPDLVSSAQNISIQRGVGSSVFGPGAFGGAVFIQTESPEKQSSQINLSYGSFNTRKITSKWNSSSIKINENRNLKLSARFSNIASDGFIDRASTQMWGYLFSAQLDDKITKNWNLKLLAFGGLERTYQAWWGIPIEKFNLGNPSNSETSEQPLIDHYYRNIPYTYRNAQDSVNLFSSASNRYNYYTYPGETDNYQQHHIHLYSDKKINNHSRFTATTYYTYGAGYFEQYRLSDELSYYGLPNIINGTDTLESSPLVRQRWLQNHLIGSNLNLFTQWNKTSLHFGLGGSQYIGQHFGDVVSVEALGVQNLPKEYYRSSGNKTDVSTFIKVLTPLSSNRTSRWNAFADLQYRFVHHLGKGSDNDLQNIDFNQTFHFFNPKAGINYQSLNQTFTASVAVSNREPTRSDFTDNKFQEIPKPERLIDYEIQHTLYLKNTHLATNLYYMDYFNQLVLTGAVNDVGTSLRKNVARSYRAGLELTLLQNLWAKGQHRLSFSGNLALSQNQIRQFTASWLDYATYEQVDSQFNNTPIAYSPNRVAAAGLNYSYGNLDIQVLEKFVGRQFLDNTGDITRSLDAYNFTEVFVNYNHTLKNKSQLQFKLQVSNALNNYFANNGYTWGYLYGSRDVIQEVFVFPTAIRNVTFSLGYQF